MAVVRLQKVLRKFKDVIAVNNVDLTVHDREFMVLLGPSGCGKTTTLRAVAGLEHVDGGAIFLDGEDITYLPPGKRNIGMVFQSYALFPHMSVFDNIAFGLKVKGVDRSIIRQRVERVAQLLHLDQLLDRYPSQLSGGQRQRAAVARSLVIEPRVLLMDEPLSNLDALLRIEMRAELKKLHNEIKATTIYVTHDQVEALSLGDRIAVMRDGRIVQCDVPIRIYDDPAEVFVGGFIGNPPMNFLEGRVTSRDGELWIEGDGFQIKPPSRLQHVLRSDRELLIGIRAENIQISPPQEDQQGVRALVHVVELLGDHRLLTVEVGRSILKVAVAPDCQVSPGDTVTMNWREDKVRLFDRESGRALRAEHDSTDIS